ncbi:MAG: YgiQ family radical SAM protein [Bacteroidales bacterium]
MFLPTAKKEVEKLGWDYVDVILITGDAYIDHPAFGIAIIARILEAHGFRVAVIPQPNWQDDLRDFKKLGAPRLFFGVSAGAMDSMVNHYTATKRLRSEDAYTPGGTIKQRPDYALSVYSTILKQLYPDVPVVIGGIEASLRRFTQYDYWSDALHKPILIDSHADMLVYGMGEKAILQIAQELAKGRSIRDIQTIPQTGFVSETFPQHIAEYTQLSSHDECVRDKKKFAQNFVRIEHNSNQWSGVTLIQPVDSYYVVVNPHYEGAGLEQSELDDIYNLPFTRKPHPRYRKKKPIPAYEMIKYSVTIHRGCFGGCSFCTISAHQGKFVASRTHESVVQELQKISRMPEFDSHITDLGGPSANMYMMRGNTISMCQACSRASCIFPEKCPNLIDNHIPLVKLYSAARSVNGIKHVTIGSGIRLDLLQGAKGEHTYMQDLITHHVSGRLKVAPEHTVSSVLNTMRKPDFNSFLKFKKDFEMYNKRAGKRQQLIPYFISAHPGCTVHDMKKLSQTFATYKLYAEQVQDFTPTPMTLSTVMYYTGLNPYTMKPVFVARSKREKEAQKSFFFSRVHTK